jgi:hypothetical protein
VARLLLSSCLGVVLLLPGAAEAHSARAHRSGHTASAPHKPAHRAASDRRATHDPARLATTLAERYWGAVPCGGQIAVQADQQLAAGMDPTTDGWVTFESALGPNDLNAPASSYTTCTISLARWQWPTRQQQAGDWNMFCLTVVHEMGHLLGHLHSPAPGSVMAAVFTDESSVPAACREARVRVETSAGLAGRD